MSKIVEVVRKHYVVALRQILRDNSLNAGTSRYNKAQLVDIINMHLVNNAPVYQHTSLNELQLTSLKLAKDLEIPNDLYNILMIFKSLKWNSLRSNKMKRFMKDRDKKLLKICFDEFHNILKQKLLEREFERELEGTGVDMETMINEKEMEKLIKKESKTWEVPIEYHNTPHVKNLCKMHMIYEIEKKCGYFIEGDEKILYHGCDKTSMDSILEHGNFSLLMSGRKHGIRYGPGIYLTNKLWKAVQYSETYQRKLHYKYVLVCKVLVNRITIAKSHDILFPKDGENVYDTGVDKMKDPVEYIKKDTNHICITGFMKIRIDNRINKLLNHNPVNNALGNGISTIMGIKFTNNYKLSKTSGVNIEIYWVKVKGNNLNNSNLVLMSSKKQTMTGLSVLGCIQPGIIYGGSTTILTLVGHDFVIKYNNVIVCSLCITKAHIRSGEVIIE